MKPTVTESHKPMKTNELKSMEPGLRAMANRVVMAERNFVGVLMRAGNITETDARTVLSAYRKAKVVKMDAVGGVLSVTHGIFLDKTTIRCALVNGRKRSANIPETHVFRFVERAGEDEPMMGSYPS